MCACPSFHVACTFRHDDLIEIDVYLQVLPYSQLMLALDVTNVRELEDFLINECMYAVCSLFTICRSDSHLTILMLIRPFLFWVE